MKETLDDQNGEIGPTKTQTSSNIPTQVDGANSQLLSETRPSTLRYTSVTAGFNNRPFRYTHIQSCENINSPSGSYTGTATFTVEGHIETPTPEFEKVTPHQPFFALQEVPSYRLLCRSRSSRRTSRTALTASHSPT